MIHLALARRIKLLACHTWFMQIRIMEKFSYTTILITGASSGIGEAIARALAKPGYHLILVARSTDALESHAREFRSTGATVDVIAMDLTSENASQNLFETINKLHIQIDLLVNNAGFGSYGYFHESDLAKQLNMIDLNIKTLVQLTHLFLPGMISRNKGAVLNVSSTASFQPVPFMATYGATKAFVTNFSMAVASELRDTPIRIISLCPGRTKTNFQLSAGSNKIRIRSRSASKEAVAQVALDAVMNYKKIAIEGLVNKCSTHLQRFFPRYIVLSLARRIFAPKNSNP